MTGPRYVLPNISPLTPETVTRCQPAGFNTVTFEVGDTVHHPEYRSFPALVVLETRDGKTRDGKLLVNPPGRQWKFWVRAIDCKPGPRPATALPEVFRLCPRHGVRLRIAYLPDHSDPGDAPDGIKSYPLVKYLVCPVENCGRVRPYKYQDGQSRRGNRKTARRQQRKGVGA
jgi:hypothetical protein